MTSYGDWKKFVSKTSKVAIISELCFKNPQKAYESYQAVRDLSIKLTEPLHIEDFGVQAMEDVSPTKWHLAHVSWFYETFILKKFASSYQDFDQSFRVIFNSYYNGVGEFHPRPKRFLLFRPSLDKVLEYRRYIDTSMKTFLLHCSKDLFEKVVPILTLGLNHEQQHQELLLTDITYNFSQCPVYPKYDKKDPIPVKKPPPMAFSPLKTGVFKQGAFEGFSFDNERPLHSVYINPVEIGSRLVTNGEYMEFIEEKGYERFEFWLSDGWDFLQKNRIKNPLYWHLDGIKPMTFGLQGLVPLDMHAPLSHISYYEAQAYAAYRGCRLPFEYEWEAYASQFSPDGGFLDSMTLNAGHQVSDNQCHGQLWQWTQSAYSPYPGFKELEGELSEYNGKFMSDQYVLKGGSYLTSRSHYRTTYRNFFKADARWQATGIRLARDL